MFVEQGERFAERGDTQRGERHRHCTQHLLHRAQDIPAADGVRIGGVVRFVRGVVAFGALPVGAEYRDFAAAGADVQPAEIQLRAHRAISS